MAATNKRLLISESRRDSNQCTPCRGKPDQHATRFSRSVRVWSMTIHISRGPHIATFHTTVNRFEQIYCTQLIFHNILWSSGEKSSFCWQPTTRLTGPYHRHAIGTFNTCSWGPTHQSLTEIGGGYNLGGVILPRTHSPTFPTSCLHIPLGAPSGLHFDQVPVIKPKCWV
jgi:hypothetical protein